MFTDKGVNIKGFEKYRRDPRYLNELIKFSLVLE